MLRMTRRPLLLSGDSPGLSQVGTGAGRESARQAAETHRFFAVLHVREVDANTAHDSVAAVWVGTPAEVRAAWSRYRQARWTPGEIERVEHLHNGFSFRTRTTDGRRFSWRMSFSDGGGRLHPMSEEDLEALQSLLGVEDWL
jgi:hypothetical protein